MIRKMIYICNKSRIFWPIMITILLEISLFNFRHWESVFFHVPEYCSVEIEDGLEKIDENGYRVVNTDTAYFDIHIEPVNVKNIWLDIRSPEKLDTRVQIIADDAANSMGLDMGSTLIISSVPSSRYLRLHLSGITHDIKVRIVEAQGFIFYLPQPEINKERPFEFSGLRVIVVFLCLLFFSMFRPGAWIYQTGLKPDTVNKKVILSLVIIFHMVLIFCISELVLPDISIQNNIDNGWPADGQYNELADALMKGQVYLDREPPQSLKSAANPYDPMQRWNVVTVMGGETFDWDYAYYNGRYYSYFGPVPAFLFFIPYKWITGMNLKTWDMVTVCSLLFCLSGFWFIYVLCQHYFKSTSFGVYLLMSSFYILGGGMIYLVYLGIVYSVPIITGLFLGTVGLACWIVAKSKAVLSKIWLVFGSICIALIMGCRPQMAIILLLSFPIFWREITKERLFFSKKGLNNTLCVIIPFLIIGIMLMYYNYLRFQTPFDFGATYNLTGNDMTHRGWEWDRIPLGIFEYLFQPLNVVPEFPFLKTVDMINDYLGYTSIEFIFSGFLIMSPLAIVSLLVFNCRKMLQKYHVFDLAVSSFAMALVIIIADTQLSGLTQRYMADFGWLLLLCSIIIVCVLERESIEKKIERVFYGAVQVLFFVSMGLNIWNVLITGRYFCLINVNPTLFFTIKHLLPFE